VSVPFVAVEVRELVLTPPESVVRPVTPSVPATVVAVLFKAVVAPPMVVVAVPVTLMSVCPVIDVLLNHVFPDAVNP
jgi:hypothetical protein